MIKKYKTLLNVNLFELTGDEIGEIKKKEREGNRYYNTILPEYCLHSENGSLRTTIDHLQWIESGEEKYILFQAMTPDDLLQEEISNTGIEDLLKNIDLRPYFNLLKKLNKDGLLHRGLQGGQYLIIELLYIGGDMYDPDWDMDVNVEGVLTSILEILKPV